MRSTFKKEEKLKKKKLIGQLFAQGRSLSAYPVKLIYLQTDHDSPYKIQTGVSVSKRNFKKAVNRNPNRACTLDAGSAGSESCL